jgi:hypothetical protein
MMNNPGLAVQPQTLRGCSCRGPEQHFLYYYTFPFFLIVEFAGGADVNKTMHHPLPAHDMVIGLIAW